MPVTPVRRQELRFGPGINSGKWFPPLSTEVCPDSQRGWLEPDTHPDNGCQCMADHVDERH